MPNFDHIAFGVAASRIKMDADKLSRAVHLALVYAKDTARGAGQADFDLLHAAACLELAARDCRLLHAKVQQLRADQNNPALIAAE
ncbi:hypothetical protein [Microvirga arsenatis]|uniref:DUF982 domain-containing protein n=1 Tax=Microvirga arsenatis TaxID=2692265 RepID=A0ABW9YUW7_9HYPH|nr:hypothetical protein [Microvirga arsenatis]NBJ13307.1 hypothetical protein [Microvirga arsenatis]NBJ24091.1 hypothetical protein [Microvirga arsenatis]